MTELRQHPDFDPARPSHIDLAKGLEEGMFAGFETPGTIQNCFVCQFAAAGLAKFAVAAIKEKANV